MRKKTHDLLVSAYRGWIKVAVAALRKAQGPMNAVTSSMINKVEEQDKAGIDPLPLLQDIRTRLHRALFEDPSRLSTSYYISDYHRDEMARLEAEIDRLEKEK